MNPDPIQEADLQSYVDGRLDPARQARVEAYLAENPTERQRLLDYQRIDAELRRVFDPMLDEPIPAQLRLSAQPKSRVPRVGLLQAAAAAGFMLVGGALGWFAHDRINQPVLAQESFVQQALGAHAVYVAEVRHPVEVEASQAQHLVAWLSKRLGATIQAPALDELGFQLLGGRLLPDDGKPAAQFMYQDGSGRRLTLYVRRGLENPRDTAFQFAEQDGKSAFYWIDRDLAYALIGDLERPVLDRAAHVVYQQLNP
ncbi:MAG: anti-sigma factor [Candidatus Competibacter sp.]|nr:anti-sigma factor [Candidatus Competibacteraceae bacterium]MBK8963933.1 anti-sigma factor [Candidatus Competibacteraceae bacterium]